MIIFNTFRKFLLFLFTEFYLLKSNIYLNWK